MSSKRKKPETIHKRKRNKPDSDSDYVPTTSESDEEILEEIAKDNEQGRFFIVSEAQLDLLFQDCRNCHKKLLDPDSSIKKTHKQGGKIKITVTCDDCKVSKEWESQKRLTEDSRISEKDVEMVIETKMNGIPTAQILDWAKGLNLNSISQTKFTEIEQEYLYPGLSDFYWNGYIQNIRSYVKEVYGNKIKICGDGRFDSRGFCAKYCVYIVVEEQSNLVIAFYLADKEEVNRASANMEPLAAKKCILELIADGFEITHFCSDRSTSVTAMLTELNKEMKLLIVHEYDVWHMVKSIMNAILKLSKTVKGRGLIPWIKSIRNQLWYSFSQAKGEVKRLYEYLDAILYHITGHHSFDEVGHEFVFRCPHSEEIDGDRKRKPYLDDSSPCIEALEVIFADKKRKKDMERLTNFLHTGMCETFNSMLGKFAPKQIFLQYPAMYGRVIMAILNFNELMMMEYKKGKDGKFVTVLSSTRHGGRRLCLVKEKSPNKWKSQIKKRIIKCVREKRSMKRVPQPNYREVTAELRKCQTLEKEEMMKSFKSRFPQVNLQMGADFEADSEDWIDEGDWFEDDTLLDEDVDINLIYQE